jgi:hypothetical protein
MYPSSGETYVPGPNRKPNLCFLDSETYYVRSEVFTAVIMKNAVFWVIKPQFLPHRKHITSPLQSPAR